MDALSGVHLHRLILGIIVPNLNDQRIDFTDIIFDYPYPFAFVESNLKNYDMIPIFHAVSAISKQRYILK